MGDVIVQQADPRAAYLSYKDEIDAAMRRVLEGGRYILGPETQAFEREFADYLGVQAGIGVGSGTEALHLALRACGVGYNDEVITVSHTAGATVAAIEQCGACPVLVDIDPMTFTMDIDQLESAITSISRAIVPVHLYGHPARMDSLMAIAKRHGLRVVEDCAQSHGASYKGRRTGAWGDIAAFSFYPTKNLGALGDAGMIVTSDPTLAQQCRLLREYGWRERYVSSSPGINSRLDELQSAILRVKLRHLDADNQKRSYIAGLYSGNLSESTVVLPRTAEGASHVYHQYVVRAGERDALRQFLADCGIQAGIHYPVPVHMQPAYKDRRRNALPVTETIATEILSLPMYPEMSGAQAELVCSSILKFLSH